MKKTALLALLTLTISCNKHDQKTITPKSEQNVELSDQNNKKTRDSIVSATATNKDGVILKQTYNITQQTAIFELNGDIIHANQDRTASGVQYSNKDFMYREHQGEVQLYKKGKLIWSNIP